MILLRSLLFALVVFGAFAFGCGRRDTATTTTSADSLSGGNAAGNDRAPNGTHSRDSTLAGAPGDTSGAPAQPAATLAGLRSQIRASRNTLEAAVTRADFATVESEALRLRDLVVALSGRASKVLSAGQVVRLEQIMHDLAEATEKLRLNAMERRADGLKAEHAQLDGLVKQLLELTAAAT